MARRQPVLQKDHPDQPERNDGPRIQDHHTRAVGARRDHYLDKFIFDFRNSNHVNDTGCNFVDFIFFFFFFVFFIFFVLVFLIVLIFVLVFVLIFVLVLFLVFLIVLVLVLVGCAWDNHDHKHFGCANFIELKYVGEFDLVDGCANYFQLVNIRHADNFHYLCAQCHP